MFSFTLFHFQLFHSLINFLFGSMHAVTITLATRQILSAPYIFRWCGICTVHVVAAVTYTGRWCWRWCCVLQCYWSSCRHSFPHQTAASGRSSIPADPEPASPPSRDRSPNIRKKHVYFSRVTGTLSAAREQLWLDVFSDASCQEQLASNKDSSPSIHCSAIPVIVG